MISSAIVGDFTLSIQLLVGLELGGTWRHLKGYLLCPEGTTYFVVPSKLLNAFSHLDRHQNALSGRLDTLAAAAPG